MNKKTLDSITYYTGTNYPFYYIYGGLSSILQPYFGADDSISKVSENHHLYISNLSAAQNHKLLKEIGITHIVNAVLGSTEPFPGEFDYMYIPLRDTEYENIQIYFDEVSKYIDNALKNNGKVLVHCMRGASRSATLVAAFIIYKGKGNITPQQAIEYIQEKRDIVSPNENFIGQLTDYYNSFNDE